VEALSWLVGGATAVAPIENPADLLWICAKMSCNLRFRTHTKRRTVNMKANSAYAKITLLLLVILLSPISRASAQDLFRQMNDLKQQVSDLKMEVDSLRSQVYEVRKAILESAAAQDGAKADQKSVSELQTPKPEPQPQVDEAELTKIICRAIGVFFSEADAALRQNDSDVAQESMRKALNKLTNSLHGYTTTHRVSKLLSIYEGVAWDTYTAVQLRGSIEGNQDFLRVLAKHKQKYSETCPGR
jgi:hypothetical protein